MSSPKSKRHLEHDNYTTSTDFKIFIQSVDETKPLGKLVKFYGEQKYFDGYWMGLFTGACCGFAVGIVSGFFIKRR
jgi:hypothetical protein